jgi:outer membrane protein OmpA-like peptidoglycan-associated protein
MIFFPRGSSEIDAQNGELLGEVVRSFLSRSGRRLRVEGHLEWCFVPENPAVAKARAEAVAARLAPMGIAPESMETVGYTTSGADESCPTPTVDTRPNGRVEFTILLCYPP